MLIDAPGQDLLELVQRMPEKDINSLVGDDLIALLNVLPGITDRIDAIRTVAVRFLHDRADELLTSARVRKLLINCMSVAKQRELASRLGISQTLDLASFSPTENAEVWQRFLGFFGIDVRSAVKFSIEPTHSKVTARFDLFPHQKRVADRAMEVVQDSHGRAILHMPTGAGKTRTAMHVLCRFLIANSPSLVVWLAGSYELLDQASDAFHSAWHNLGDRSVELVRVWGDHSPNFSTLEDAVVIGGFSKLHSYMTRHPIEFLRLAQKVKLVIVDEAHQSIAPTYKALIETLTGTGPYHSLLGLTATPGRTWADVGADAQLAHFFGDRKITIEIEGWNNPVAYLIQEGYLAKPTFNHLHYQLSDELDAALGGMSPAWTDYSDEALDCLAKDATRSAAIIKEVERLIGNAHHRIILFGSSVRHAEICAAILAVKGINTRIITAETNKTIRRQNIDAYKNGSNEPMVLCNFGVLTTGFDAPNTSAAVIARPTRSLVLYSQMVGRAARGPKAGGNAFCEISTVVDTRLPGFGDMEEAFINWEDVWHEQE